MFDSGHFCLLIFAQGAWKESYKKNLIKKISRDFLSLLEPKSEEEAKQIRWNEIDKSPLFDPKLEGRCEVCENLYKVFDAKKGSNEGLIFFSHNVPDEEGFKTFFTPLFGEDNIKKIYYLELDPWSERKLLSIDKIEQKQVNPSKLFALIDKNQFKLGVLYEISKHI